MTLLTHIFTRKYLPVLLTFFLSPALYVNAQIEHNLRFDRYASEEYRVTKGLSQNTVNCIMQDSYGFLWFGTWDGLNRYDGKNFVSYKPSRQKANESLSNQTVHSMIEDDKGYLWIATDKGLCCFDRKNQEFNYYMSVQGDETTLSSDTVNVILPGNDGSIWVGTNNGLNKFDPVSGKCVRYMKAGSDHMIRTVNCMVKDRSGNLWIGMTDGLLKYDAGAGTFSIYGEKQGEFTSNKITSLYIDKEEILWVGTDNGLQKIDTGTGKVIMVFSFKRNESRTQFNQWITAILEDSEGTFWIGTYGNGLLLMDKNGNNIRYYSNLSGDNHSLSNDYISTIFEDDQGNIWVGTSWKGVNKYNPHAYNFIHYRHTPYNPQSLSNNIVWSFLEMPDGKIWVATDGGVNIFDPGNETFTSISYKKDDPGSLAGNNVRSFCKDKKGNIWIGYLLSGLSCYNPATKKMKHYSNSPGCDNCLSNNTVWDILVDRNGMVWLATFNGLDCLDPETGTFVTYKEGPEGKGLSNSIVYSLLEDHLGNIWIATNYGLNRFDIKTKVFSTFICTAGCANCISNNNVFGLYEDKQGILWIGTMGGGLNRYDPKTKKITVYTESNGLANNVVYDIVPDKDNHLWLSTNHGISKFDPSTGIFTNYDVTDGLQGFEHNLGAAYRNSEGELFFGGMNGFNILKTEKLPDKKNISPVLITGFRIFNEVNYREYTDGDTIVLDYKDNFFTFLFAMLDFSDASKIQYEYLLENIDKIWHRTDAQRQFAEYTNIEPGKYKFHLRSIVPNPGIKTKETCIVLIINPPWYATWLFRSLAIFIIVVTISVVVWLSIRRARRRHAIAKAMLDMEKRLFDTERKALRLQMNPHFIFNTLNAIQYFVFQSDKLSANRYISMFSKLMRQILVNSQNNTILLKDEIEALELYIELELLRFGDKFEYRIIVRPDESILQKYIPSMILQPYVENAIRHGLIYREEKGLLKIEISASGDEKVVCLIEDNGVGRERAEEIRKRTKPEHVSLGTKITESRLKLMNNLYKSEMTISIIDLKDEKNEAIGTRAEIIIPTF